MTLEVLYTKLKQLTQPNQGIIQIQHLLIAIVQNLATFGNISLNLFAHNLGVSVRTTILLQWPCFGRYQGAIRNRRRELWGGISGGQHKGNRNFSLCHFMRAIGPSKVTPWNATPVSQGPFQNNLFECNWTIKDNQWGRQREGKAKQMFWVQKFIFASL